MIAETTQQVIARLKKARAEADAYVAEHRYDQATGWLFGSIDQAIRDLEYIERMKRYEKAPSGAGNTVGAA